MCEQEHLNGVRRIQLADLELIRLFADICEKEHLRYYMLDGTMLGAVRHKGFIPWDDDVDFGMPRPDYEKFLQIVEDYIPEGIFLSTLTTDPNCRKYFLQLATKKQIVTFKGRPKPHSFGAWLDVFPLDGMPENYLLNKIHQKRILVLRKLFTISVFDSEVLVYKPHRTWLNRVGVFICTHFPLQKLVPMSKIWARLDRTLKMYSYEESRYLVNSVSGYKFKEMFPKEVFGEGAFYEFEGMQLRGPQDYKTYLTQLYGDYTTPPPESERNWHNIEILEQGGVIHSCNFRIPRKCAGYAVILSLITKTSGEVAA